MSCSETEAEGTQRELDMHFYRLLLDGARVSLLAVVRDLEQLERPIAPEAVWLAFLAAQRYPSWPASLTPAELLAEARWKRPCASTCALIDRLVCCICTYPYETAQIWLWLFALGDCALALRAPGLVSSVTCPTCFGFKGLVEATTPHVWFNRFRESGTLEAVAPEGPVTPTVFGLILDAMAINPEPTHASLPHLLSLCGLPPGWESLDAAAHLCVCMCAFCGRQSDRCQITIRDEDLEVCGDCRLRICTSSRVQLRYWDLLIKQEVGW